MFSLVELALPLVAALSSLFKILVDARAAKNKEKQTEQKIETIEERAEKEPEKIRFAWDLARVKLEAYFDRNLNQVKSIFWVSILVMSVGFGLLFYGIVRSMNNPSNLQASYVSAVAGIITEFIGLTFMVIYRSTLAQAGSFMTILERINAVGMAVQILDSISNTHDDLKNVTRAELVKMLLNTGSSAWERNVVGGETGHKPRGSAIRPAKLIQRSEVSPQPEPSNE